MLILTRRAKEAIVIGDNEEIKITILNIRGGQVQIGVDAPKSLSVHREEVYQRILKGDAPDIATRKKVVKNPQEEEQKEAA